MAGPPCKRGAFFIRISGHNDQHRRQPSVTEDSPEDRIFKSPFQPAWWLSNRHAQTMYPSLPWSGTPKVELESELLELPDGDTTVVDWVVGRPAADTGAPLLIILHGLEGSANSS